LDVLLGARLLRRLGAETTLLHVSRDDQAPSDGTPGGIALRHLEQGANTLRGQGIACEVRVRRGSVVAEILAEAVDGGYDLVVVGAHIPSGRSRFAQRDFAAQIAREVDRSLLVVRGAVD
jgi:nucleotide-binding universal stress UspA family protein